MSTTTVVAANCVTISNDQDTSGSTIEYEDCIQQMLPPAPAVAAQQSVDMSGPTGAPTVFGMGLNLSGQAIPGFAGGTYRLACRATDN